ncbi:ATP-binding protein [Bacillus sp. 3255]|uniref:sensor histidine kinase n=1 Tax=Bacillus sp. 3255 TaxID=2817904 RepID=UPI00285F8A51|nr:ATP-binding protein [Bacillus sp. 3255]MDR6881444.1 NarL family two-component system sensor histidine kinase LiaS [Bacillus sp. 3255]
MVKMFSGESRVFYLYRFISLAATSFVYAIEDRGPPLGTKFGIILMLFIFAVWVTNRYIQSGKASRTIQITVGLEMAGMIVLHLLSGGMDSPFLWCVFNPVWMAASHISSAICWLMMLSYFAFMTAYSYFVTNDQMHALDTMLLNDHRMYLALLLMTLIVQLVANVINRLEAANTRTTETMEHMKSLFQIVEAATHSDSEYLKIVFAEFALKLTKVKMSFFWDAGGSQRHNRLITQGVTPIVTGSSLSEVLDLHEIKLRQLDGCSGISLAEYGDFLVIPVKLPTRLWGVMGVTMEQSGWGKDKDGHGEQLSFLSELCSVILERHELERMEHQMMITEEQNRIADEMHDNVSPYMFGIVYAVHSLSRKWKDITKDQIKEQLQIIQESSVAASQELRSTIYSLSTRKNGSDDWMATVRSHLDSMSKLHAVEVKLQVTGDAQCLRVQYQKALYRIISESAGNAIRHGRSTLIQVDLSIKPEEAELAISDNGVGFNVRERLSEHSAVGLGIHNMQLQVQSLGGKIRIQSTEGKGTHIQLSLPFQPQEDKAYSELEMMG